MSRNGITKELLTRHLPKGTSHKVTDEILKTLSMLEDDTGLEQEYLEEQVMANLSILGEIRTNLPAYLNAVKYCSLIQNMSNRKAWEIVFPEKLERLTKLMEERIAAGRMNSVNIDSHVKNYNGIDLVVKIQTQIRLGFSIKYAFMADEAVKKQYDLMNGIGAKTSDRVSATVQHLAAKELFEMVKMPEDNSVELKIGMSDDAKDFKTGLLAQLARIGDSQMEKLNAGASINEIQRLGLKEVISSESDNVIEAEVE